MKRMENELNELLYLILNEEEGNYYFIDKEKKNYIRAIARNLKELIIMIRDNKNETEIY